LPGKSSGESSGGSGGFLARWSGVIVEVKPRVEEGTSVTEGEWLACTDGLSILSDALEEVGCDDAEILEHCRGEGPHVRGCWLVDIILGKQ